MRIFNFSGLRLAAAGLLLAAAAPVAMATPSFGTSTPWNAATTFQSIGLYWKPANAVAADGTVQRAAVRFREQNASTWRDGLDLWYDGRNAEYRGSLVELKPNTTYEIQLKLGGGAWTNTTASCNTASANECALPQTASCNSTTQTQCTRTWSEDFTPLAGYTVTVQASGIRRIDINGSAVTTPSSSVANGVMTITVSNADDPASYTVIQGVNYPASRSLVQGVDRNGENCINITGASHVVIRGLEIANCARTAISMGDDTHNNNHHIVIDDNDIHGWGGWGDDNNGTFTHHPDGDGAIQCRNPANRSVNQVVIQRNLIHDPRWSATYWGQTTILQPNPADPGDAQNALNNYHPTGPSATNFELCGNNHVIRYNDIFATESTPGQNWYDYPEQGIKYFQDAITGADNQATSGSGGTIADPGFPYADSDIYGNRISHAHDDGIESEGYNRNVRIWKNYTNKVFVNIANSWNTQGPLYVWRNVSDLQAHMYPTNVSPDDNTTTLTDRGPFIKGGDGGDNFGAGRSYYFHNTALQAPPSTCGAVTYPCGAGSAIRRDGEYWNVYSKNNIWHDGWREPIFDLFCGDHQIDSNVRCDIDFDMLFAVTASPLTKEDAGSGTRATAPFSSESNGLVSAPTFVSGGAYPNARPTLASPTGNFQITGTGANAGTLIPNFNDLYSTRDIGAQSSNENMTFGRAAAAPTVSLDLADPSDTGPSNTDNITSVNRPTFIGTAASGSTVQIFDGTTLLGSVTATNGTYSFIPATALADGIHTITAKIGTLQSPAVTVTIDTQAPSSAAITAPTNGSSVSGAVTVTASTDAAGVFGVQFRLNGNPLNTEDTSAPYSTSWDTTTVADGTYALTAVARDTAGNSVTSTAISVVVSNAPPPLTPPPSTPDLSAASDSGTSSTDNLTNVTLPTFTGTATAGTTVTIFSDGIQVGSGPITGGTYSVTLATALTAGTHNITAKASNATSTTAASGALSVTIDVTAPATSISTPASGATVGGTVALTATATDANGVAGVQFKLDGAALQTEDTASPYSINWDTTTATNGSHTLTAVGRDSAGNSVTSAAVTVTVSNGTNSELNVSISPPNGTASTATGEHLDVTVGAGVGLSSVKFYIDNVLRATLTAAPYTFSWVTATETPGNHTLKVEATSAAGTLTETRPLTLLATTCEIFANPLYAPQGSPVMLQGLCAGSKNVAEMQFLVDGVLQASDPSSTYTATLDTSRLSVGTHTITATGSFTSPAGTSSASRTINVTQPVLSLDLMPGAVVVYDEKITFTASVNDGRQLKQVDFYLDGTLKSGNIVAPYELTWTGGLADLGRHTMEVRATDANGAVVSTTRDILLTPHTCSMELGSSRYRQAGADTVYAGPHKVAQGQRVSVRAECSAWMNVNRVEFYLNGVLQSTLTGAPYAWSVDTSALTAGQTYTVSTKGYLTNGVVSNDAVAVQIVAP